jgi:hypothetical protein
MKKLNYTEYCKEHKLERDTASLIKFRGYLGFKGANRKFDFWKNNRKDQHHQKTMEELIQLFKEWLPTKEQSWLEYYASDAVIRGFLAIDEGGLHSVFDEDQYNEIYEGLKPVYMEFVYPHRANIK